MSNVWVWLRIPLYVAITVKMNIITMFNLVLISLSVKYSNYMPQMGDPKLVLPAAVSHLTSRKRYPPPQKPVAMPLGLSTHLKQWAQDLDRKLGHPVKEKRIPNRLIATSLYRIPNSYRLANQGKSSETGPSLVKAVGNLPHCDGTHQGIMKISVVSKDEHDIPTLRANWARH